MLSIKGIYNKGYVKRTNGQIKKHRVQMTDEEVNFLVKKIKELNTQKVYLSKHAQNNNVTTTIEQILSILKSDYIKDCIIEYNETPCKGTLEHRILLRDIKSIRVTYNEGMKDEFEALSNLCFVICIDNAKIVTTYYNIDEDSHDTLNLYRYDKNLKIIK